ncbi:unnamed protein product [Didymodactylos carnosus]|uniref:Uncharacterized protein n=1 Tax=Didymodactylos carnosus TaxID=1234261 RepID=A0A814R994_9BILA|nr:unnamed protein product [Didymodactylos carnosus]CAF1599565.1 unnamed protein product [Didymodactylos carnosus]CAF3894039.1 unnamed protein product [Didymodactylos carnosus]CAF4407514.1 unnamed protein product [Didymodactylos carnosus]
MKIDPTKSLNSYYSVYGNYRSVYDDVMSWFGATRLGCVAFLTTAMRHVEIEIPQEGTINGKGISINTEGFESYLKNVLKWTVYVDAADQLRPGDVVITQDREGYIGHPDHVYMFHQWLDQNEGIALVIDNQLNTEKDFIHPRNIVGNHINNVRTSYTPYARHYRCPSAESS